MSPLAVVTILAVCLIHQGRSQVAGGSCTQSIVTNVADPINCSKYFKCLNSVYVDFVCPAGLIFSPNTAACDFPPTTGGTCNPTTFIPSTLSPVPIPPNGCPIAPCTRQVEYLLPNYNKPGNSDFYVCREGKLYEMTCGVAPGTLGFPNYNVLRTSCEKTKSFDSLY